MIIERREILFDLVEVHSLLYEAFNTNPRFEKIVPVAFSSYRILGALHTRGFMSVPQEMRASMMGLVDPAPPTGVIFRIVKKSASSYDKEIGFVVPEDLIVGLLVEACVKRKIMLPRNAPKVCITKDLCVGLEFVLQAGGFELES